jgi:hypothetical protein
MLSVPQLGGVGVGVGLPPLLPPQELFEQESLQEEAVFGVDEQEVPLHSLWVPETAWVQKELVVPGKWQLSVVQLWLSLQPESLLQVIGEQAVLLV